MRAVARARRQPCRTMADLPIYSWVSAQPIVLCAGAGHSTARSFRLISEALRRALCRNPETASTPAPGLNRKSIFQAWIHAGSGDEIRVNFHRQVGTKGNPPVDDTYPRAALNTGNIGPGQSLGQ